MAFYKSKRADRVEIPCFIETTESGKSYITGTIILQPPASYSPVHIVIPAELKPYISDMGYICGKHIFPTDHIRWDGKKAFLKTDLFADELEEEVIELVCPIKKVSRERAFEIFAENEKRTADFNKRVMEEP